MNEWTVSYHYRGVENVCATPSNAAEALTHARAIQKMKQTPIVRHRTNVITMETLRRMALNGHARTGTSN